MLAVGVIIAVRIPADAPKFDANPRLARPAARTTNLAALVGRFAWAQDDDGPLVPEDAPSPDGPVTVGVRPEHLSLGNGINSFDAGVEVIEQLGSEIILETRVGDARMTVARVDPQVHLAVGEMVPLSVQPERLHFFDPMTDAAIR